MSKKELKLGLWRKTSKGWLGYYSGYIEDSDLWKVRVTLFKNTKKVKDNQPDLNLIIEIESEDNPDNIPDEEVPF